MDDDFRPLKTSDLQAKAKEAILKLEEEGTILRPIPPVTGKNLAKTFWAKAWMKHLARSEYYSARLAPGRSYLRNGCVIDLDISQSRITALVSAERVYEVEITFDPIDDEQLDIIRNNCGHKITSWIDLLHGKLSEDILEELCREDAGILPDLGNMACSCNCPDWADICKHTAAALYGAGVRLDTEPELLFLLRNISLEQLLPKNGEAPPPPSELNDSDLSSLFGINMDE